MRADDEQQETAVQERQIRMAAGRLKTRQKATFLALDLLPFPRLAASMKVRLDRVRFSS